MLFTILSQYLTTVIISYFILRATVILASDSRRNEFNQMQFSSIFYIMLLPLYFNIIVSLILFINSINKDFIVRFFRIKTKKQ